MDLCIDNSDVFKRLKRVMKVVNNVDVGEFGAGRRLPGVQAHAQTPKSRRIEVLNWKGNFCFIGES